ncbi:MAG: CAP domain-containing protein [Cytophagales bacterium]|nr:CAP domain-containing protein [Cytophagales bacterium]
MIKRYFPFCLVIILSCQISVLFAQSKEEEVLTLLNLIRTNPKGFIESHLNDYLQSHNMAQNGYAKSLLTDLKKTEKMSALQFSEPLTKVARMHAVDMGKSGTVGHTSSDGTSFSDRLRNKAKAKGTIAENCDYGNGEPLDIVMSLLIDDGITSLGHRKNILEPSFRWVGVAIEDHKIYRVNCVMDFAEKF